MDEIKTNAAQEPAEDQEESLILKFRKPYMFEGKEYTEVDLSAMEDMTAEDLCAMGKIMTGMIRPGSPASFMAFSIRMAMTVSRNVMIRRSSFFSILSLPGQDPHSFYSLLHFFHGIKMRKAEAHSSLRSCSKCMMHQRRAVAS